MTTRRTNPNRIGAAWNQFSHAILDPMNAPQIQRQGMRRAFYAGASSLFTIVTTQLTEGEQPQEPDLQMMDDLLNELNGFSDAVSAGRA